jgi:hypothetical protein
MKKLPCMRSGEMWNTGIPKGGQVSGLLKAKGDGIRSREKAKQQTRAKMLFGEAGAPCSQGLKSAPLCSGCLPGLDGLMDALTRTPDHIFGKVTVAQRPLSRDRDELRSGHVIHLEHRIRTNTPQHSIHLLGTPFDNGPSTPPTYSQHETNIFPPAQLDKLVGLAMLVAASVVFLYYTIWTLLMVRPL